MWGLGTVVCVVVSCVASCVACVPVVQWTKSSGPVYIIIWLLWRSQTSFIGHNPSQILYKSYKRSEAKLIYLLRVVWILVLFKVFLCSSWTLLSLRVTLKMLLASQQTALTTFEVCKQFTKRSFAFQWILLKIRLVHKIKLQIHKFE